jgi:antimicrobial peptide system SdpB family protein
MLTRVAGRVRAMLGMDPHNDSVSVARGLLYLAGAATLFTNSPRMLLAPSGGPVDDIAALSMFHSNICTGYQALSVHCVTPAGGHDVVQALLAVFLLVGAVGWRPRWTCLVAAWIFWSNNVTFGLMVSDGGDRVATILALLLVPIGLADDRRWAWRRFATAGVPSLTAQLVARYALALAALQMALIYGHSVIAKVAMPVWREGTALYYIAHDPSEAFGTLGPEIIPLLRQTPVSQALTWSTLLVEAVLVLGLLLPRERRRLLLVPGVAFHAAIGVVMGLTSFALVMIAGLILYAWPLRPRAAAEQRGVSGASADVTLTVGVPVPSGA